MHKKFAAIVLAWIGLQSSNLLQAEFDFEDYRQILPRGGISAITEPEYVSAEEADIADDSYVLGIMIDDQARAYSLNILNHHEVVNDQIGKQTFAAVW
jgi:hypothetical protein